jgi:hypothetical protein
MSIQLYIYAEARSKAGEPWTLAVPTVPNHRGWMQGWPVAPAHIGDENQLGLQAIFFGRRPNFETVPDIERIPAQPGLPIDLSPDLQRWAAATLNDYLGSVGWITLADVLAFGWNRTIQVTSKVGTDFAHRFTDPTAPFPEDLEDQVIFPRGDRVPVTWTETYRDLAGPKFAEDLDRLSKKHGDPESVRLVFWIG